MPHNRVTRHLRLEPFSLAETRAFLEARRVALDDYQILELYMALGGIMRTPQFGRDKKDAVYRLADEHSLFHLHWIEEHRGRREGAWLGIRGSPAWRAWSGYSFEGVCLKHADPAAGRAGDRRRADRGIDVAPPLGR